MWVSNYNIYIPLHEKAHYLLVHGYTGAVDCVDAELVRALQECFAKHFNASTLNLPPDVYRLLEKRGYLTELSPEEEIAFVGRLARKIHALQFERTEFWIIPSYNCQLRCKYCFERSVQKRGENRGWLTQKMSTELVDAAFAVISTLQGKDANTRITLYGGEPLLPANRKIVQYIVEQGISLGYRFNAFSNGVDVNLYEDMLGPGRIEQLHITIDGPQSTHDRLRVYKNGKGTFDRITRNIQLALSHEVRVSLRVNVTWDVLACLDELAQLVQQLGWDENPNLRIHCHAIHSNQEYQRAASNSSIRKLEPYVANVLCGDQVSCIDNAKVAWFIYKTGLHERGLGGLWSADLYMASLVDKLLTGKPGCALSAISCGSHGGFYIFDPFGDIYPCDRLVGNPQHRIGVFAPQLGWAENKQIWHERTVYNIPTCQQCQFALYCAGGCAQQALLTSSDLYSPYCADYAQRFETSMLVKYLSTNRCANSAL